MPRLAKSEVETILFEKGCRIENGMKFYGYSKQHMADKLGISLSAMCYKLKDPGKFSGLELAKINHILHIPKEERV